jgi:hypothetical protein
MIVEDYLYKAQSALTCLEHLFCYYDNTASMPPEDFGPGLYTILSCIKDDVAAAYNELTEPKEKAE